VTSKAAKIAHAHFVRQLKKLADSAQLAQERN